MRPRGWAAGSGIRVAVFAIGIALYGLVAAGTPAFASGSCSGDTAVPASATASRAALTLVCDINAIRTRNGLPKLRVNDRLWTVANDQATDMARTGNLTHVDSEGRDLEARVAASGYLAQNSGGTVAENIGWGDGDLATPASIADAWMESDEHRAKVLDPDMTDIAVAVAPGSDGVYYAADFGATGVGVADAPPNEARQRLRKRRHGVHPRRPDRTRMRC
jgi:uncharacterized protein YkwD